MDKGCLAKEIIIEVPRRKVLKLGCLVVISVLLINAFSFYLLRENTPNLGYKIIAKKWEILEKMKESKDWLILGDSTCNQGVSVSEFEKNTGESAVNLCTIGDVLVVNDSWILKKYIEKFGPPKNILIIHAYDVWQRDEINLNLASRLPVVSMIKEKPSPWFFSKKEEATLFFYKYLPLYSEKTSLMRIIRGVFKKEDGKNLKIVFDDNGFMPVEFSDPDNVAISLEGHKKFLEKNKFKISPKNILGLDSIKEMAENYGFNVFIVNSPINSELSKNDNFKSYFSDISNYLEDYAEKSDRVYYIDSIYPFDIDEMISCDHIDKNAAIKYSKKISEDIENACLGKSCADILQKLPKNEKLDCFE